MNEERGRKGVEGKGYNHIQKGKGNPQKDGEAYQKVTRIISSR